MHSYIAYARARYSVSLPDPILHLGLQAASTRALSGLCHWLDARLEHQNSALVAKPRTDEEFVRNGISSEHSRIPEEKL